MIVADKLQTGFDEIIEKFNAHYANAGVEMEGIIDDLASDESLRMNVINSAPCAYESEVEDKISDRINELLESISNNAKSKNCTSKKDKILLKK